MNDWSLSLKNNNATDNIFVVFKEAFDSVSHQKLVSQIESYGIRGNLLEWLNAFLTARIQAVEIHNCILSNNAITSGVPKEACYAYCRSYCILMTLHILLLDLM
jgi:hypothetical protein